MANQVHPTAVIEGDVRLGDENRIGPFCHLRGPLVLGSGNRISSHVCLGLPGQDTREPHYDDSGGLVVFGDENIVREFTSVQQPRYEAETRIGDRVHLMQSVHVPHDALIEDDAVVTPMVAVAGCAHLLAASTLSLGASVVQFVVVGQFSIVAAGAIVRKNVRPFIRHIPGQPDSVNSYAVEKFGFQDDASEIRDYVELGVSPRSASVRRVVDHFEREAEGRDAARRTVRS